MRNIERNVMKSVRIEKDRLLSTIRENLVAHVEQYTESVEDYVNLVKTIAKHNYKIANTGDIEKFGKLKSFPKPPTSYEDSYTKAIRMLEFEVESVIEIDETTFNQLVLDEWGWKSSFVSASTFYKSESAL